MSNRIIHFGVIGCGNAFRHMHLPAFKQTNKAKIVALCDTNRQKLKELDAEIKTDNIYTNFHELIDDPKVESVLIAVPPTLNRDIVLYAAEKRKHILLEKPIAASLQDAGEMIDKCRSYGVKFCVNHQRRFSACEQKAKQVINEGLAGELLHIKIRQFIDGLDSYRKDNSWETNSKIAGGGIWLIWGIHYADIFRFLTNDEVAHIHAEIGSKMEENGKGEETAFALLRTKGGTIGELQVSWVHRSTDEMAGDVSERVEIYGSLGTITYYRQMGTMKVYSVLHGDPEVTSFCFESNRGGATNMINMEKHLHEKFISAIVDNAEVPVPGEEAYKALKIIIAGYESAKNRRVIDL